ncbi:MAG: hypothetical protein KDK05_21110, partial [Candidatus Competibacteraceae bacterium]|nr:hypothetical protein [Candidatus Competibacteraceae bacterium]
EGTDKTGAYFLIPGSKPDIVVCEGLTTGASVSLATGYTVAIAVDCGNVGPTIASLKAVDSNRRIIIGADNDQWGDRNAGLVHACAAAQQHGVDVAVPDFTNLDTSGKPTDFNDLHQLAGLTEVARQIEQASTPAAVFCQQTVTAIQRDKPRLVAIKAVHATGKTQHIIKPIVAGVLTVLAITHRRTLANDTANNIGVENYQNITDSADAAARGDRLIICVNSLIKLKYQTAAALNVPDVLVLDETRQLLDHMAAAHGFKKDAGAITERFWQLVKSAKQVVLADADLDESIVAEFEQKLGCKAEWYRYEPKEPQLEIEFMDYAQGLPLLQDALEHDKVLLAADSLKALDEVSALAGSDLLKIHTKTTGTTAVKTFLANPNAHITEHRHLFFSPSIASGVSLQQQHFTRHFAIYTGTITAADFIQLIRRDRTARKITVLFRNIQKKPNLPVSLQAAINAMKIAYTVEYGESGIKLSAFDDLRFKRTIERNKALVDARASLIALCKKRGFTVTENTTAPHNKPMVTLLKQRHETSKREAIQAAEPLDDFTAEAIERGQRGLTPELANQLERWRITSTYRLPADAPIETEIFDRWDDGRGLRAVKFADNIFGSLDAVATRSRHDAQLEASLCRFPKFQRLMGQQLLNLLRIDINTGWGGFNKDDALAAWQAMKACAAECQKAGIDVPKKQPKYPAKWAAQQLAKMGLKTTSKRTRAQGRQRDYYIERESWDFVQSLVARRSGPGVVHMPPIVNTYSADVDHPAASQTQEAAA